MFSLITISILYIDAAQFGFLTYLLAAAALLIAFIIFSDKGLNRVEKQKVAVIFIVSFFVVFFWASYEQTGASLNLFADRQTNRRLGFTLPLYVLYLVGAVVVAYCIYLWTKAVKNLRTNDRSLLTGVGIILFLVVAGIVSYLIYLGSQGEPGLYLKEVPASLFQSLNSIFVVLFAPVFAFLWLKMGRREPSAPTKMAMGLFLLALGYLWIAVGVKDVRAGMTVSMIWLTGLYALHTWGELCLSPIGLSLVNKLAPLKFASLLMAVWFLANAAANKLAGVLSALAPLDGRKTSLLGYRINTIYDFFILFVVMAGLASLILFLLTRRLQKMMHTNG